MKRINRGQLNLILNNVFNAKHPLEVLQHIDDLLCANIGLVTLFGNDPLYAKWRRRVDWVREFEWRANETYMYGDAFEEFRANQFHIHQLRRNEKVSR